MHKAIDEPSIKLSRPADMNWSLTKRVGGRVTEIDRPVALGVEDALKEIPGVTTAMLVTLGENGIKTVEDLAGCATDDLSGWSERKDGETTRYPGFLDGFELSRDDAEALIMQARVKAGWIKEEDLAPPPAEEPAESVEATGAPA